MNPLSDPFWALQASLSAIAPLSAENWTLFRTAITEVSCKKGENLLTAGQVCRSVYFVKKGALRTFFLREDNEINTHFFFENSFITNLKSLRQQTPADLTIQTLENSTLFRFFATDLLRLYEQSPEIESLGRKLLELLLMEQEDQTRSFQLYSPQQRYQLLLEKQPHILQRISLTHLASYLGISRESLSRIRNRIRE